MIQVVCDIRERNMKTSSLALLVLYYFLGCCYGYKDIHKIRKNIYKKSWREQNRLGSKRERTLNIGRLNFAVTPPPTKTVSIGESFRLLCKLESMPSATVYWTKDGERIIQGDDLGMEDNEPLYEDQAIAANRPTVRLSSQTSRVYVDCFTPDKAGIYECVAETPYKKIMHKTIVKPTCVVTDPSFFAAGYIFRLLNHVLCSGNSISETVDTQCLMSKKTARMEPARIYLFTTYRIEMANATVQLLCRAEGNPKPTITWFDRERNPIGPNTLGYKQLQNGDLVLQSWNLSPSFHFFWCEAENGFGVDTVETKVYLTA